MSERLQQRVKLALAIGWQRVGRTAETSLWYPPGCKAYGPFGAEEPPDPWISLDDCAACDAWIWEQMPFNTVTGERPSLHRVEITRETDSLWSVWYDRQILGDDLAETWADAIYSVVVGDE